MAAWPIVFCVSWDRVKTLYWDVFIGTGQEDVAKNKPPIRMSMIFSRSEAVTRYRRQHIISAQ